MIGIYCITNKVNNKKYIGQSINVYGRFNEHKYNLINCCHVNSHLQAAWNKYGKDSFEFTVIEECKKEDLDTKEIHWIQYFDSYNSGYNMDKGGQGIVGFKHTSEQIDKMRRIQNPLVVLQFNMDFKLLNRFIGGASHAAKELGYTRDRIKSRCEHKCQRIPYKDSYWVYEDEYNDSNFSWDNYLQNISKYQIKRNPQKIYNNQKICQYTLDRELIKVWSSFSEIANAGFIRSQVSDICKKRKGKKTHRGFIWAFESYDFSDGYFDKTSGNTKSSLKKPIIQYDKNGKFVERYQSVTDAATRYNTGVGVITKAAKHHRISFNSFWAYENDNWIEKYNGNLSEIYMKSQVAQRKRVIQYDLEYNIVATYESLTDAACSVNTSVGNISRAIKEPKRICRNSHWGCEQ